MSNKEDLQGQKQNGEEPQEQWVHAGAAVLQGLEQSLTEGSPLDP